MRSENDALGIQQVNPKMVGRDELLRRQRALGDFGEFVLRHDNLQEVLQESCRLIADALGADLAKVVEIERETNTGLVRAGVGWKSDVVGKERIDLGERTSEAYAIETSEPVITTDIATETRFHFPDFMKRDGVRAAVNVPIVLPGRKAWGLLQVDAREPRDFDDEDIEFLRTYAMVLGPVIDRLQTVDELKQTGERLHLIVENAHGYVIALSDADDIITDWLAGSEQILGWTAKEIIGQPAAVIFTPEDREAGVPQRETSMAKGAGAAPNVRWHLRKDGSRVFLDGQTVALRSANGDVRGFLKIGQDVTDRKENEERQAVLLAELQHRVRNVLAMVRSLVQRTASGDRPIEQIRQQLEGRIDALARTQALLTRALGAGVDLQQLVRDELDGQAADEDGFTISGPAIELAPKAAEVVTLAVHELATNASKYGALKHEGARLTITWSVDERDGTHWLQLSWREDKVPMAAEAKRRTGFGTELITRRVPYELRGEGRIDFHDAGLEAVIGFPLRPGTSVLQTSEPS
jgi:PAS domain S-box-containing protein